jgi:hypothetical protein
MTNCERRFGASRPLSSPTPGASAEERADPEFDLADESGARAKDDLWARRESMTPADVWAAMRPLDARYDAAWEANEARMRRAEWAGRR